MKRRPADSPVLTEYSGERPHNVPSIYRVSPIRQS